MLQFKIENRIEDILNFLDGKKYSHLKDLEWQFTEEDETRRKPPVDLDWEDITLPHPYGKEYVSFWFRTQIDLNDVSDKEVYLYCRPQSDSLVFIDEEPLGAVNLHHERIRIDNIEKKKFDLYVESYGGHIYPGCHPVEGDMVVLTIGKTIPSYPNHFLNGSLEVKNQEIYNLFYDAKVLFESAKEMDKDSLLKAEILQGLFDSLIKLHRMADIDQLSSECQSAREQIKPLLERTNGSTAIQCDIMGHAHIDHAWLWPIAETEKKIARTFANMCHYAEEFPEFKFLQSQPCQIESVKKLYPEVFEKVLKAYKNGQWEPNGGMFVEADCNIPSGESLIRQFMYGRKITKELFDYEGDTLWLPDVFGYSPALPTILAGCGIKNFITSKINWNDTTKFPYDKFIWKGVDNSEVNTLFILDCFGGYNGATDPKNIMDSWRNCQHKEIQNSMIKPIGEGDGGGGTHRSDIEMARRLKNLEGMPKVEWKTISESMDEAFQNRDRLPEWKGELYLELHRGTYTSQSLTKRNNRKIEFKLALIESLMAMAYLKNQAFSDVNLDDYWKELLTYQFHDIIPGSSIELVYKEANEGYARILDNLQKIESELIESMSQEGSVDSAVIYNNLGHDRHSYAALPYNEKMEDYSHVQVGDSCVEIHKDQNIDGKEFLRFPVGMQSTQMANATFLKKEKEQSNLFTVEDNVIKTPFYTVKFSERGSISEINQNGFNYVKEEQEINNFVLAEDTPVFWDAWDIDYDYRFKEENGAKLINKEVITNDSHILRIRFNYSLGKESIIHQDVVFYSADPRIDFETKVDWKEKRHLLKVEFPVNIQADESIGDTQFGYLKRPTHQNRPEDRARFEVCAHKWMALSDGLTTAAVLNDCKYGWDVYDNNIRLTLLKAPIAPDKNADQGIHYFTYSFLPVQGHDYVTQINSSSLDLNQPVVVYPQRTIENASLLSNKDHNIEVVSVKPSEERDGIIIRLAEVSGVHCKSELLFLNKVQSIESTNMLEDSISPIIMEDNCLSLEFKPFEVRTVKVDFIK